MWLERKVCLECKGEIMKQFAIVDELIRLNETTDGSVFQSFNKIISCPQQAIEVSGPALKE